MKATDKQKIKTNSNLSKTKKVANRTSQEWRKDQKESTKTLKKPVNEKKAPIKNAKKSQAASITSTKKTEVQASSYYESDFESDEEDKDLKILEDLKNIKKDLEEGLEDSNAEIKVARPSTTKIDKFRTANQAIKNVYGIKNDLVYRANQNKVNRAKELLELITLNTVEFELVNILPIDYKEPAYEAENVKQIGIQSIECKDVEIQLEKQLNLIEKSTQTPFELKSNQDNHFSSINELFRLKKFLLKAENILNQVLTKSKEIEYKAEDLKKFGHLFKLDYQFNQLISFHSFNDLAYRMNYSLVIFWDQNQTRQVLFCREKVCSSLEIENGIFILGTENGTILIYDITNRNQIRSNLNLPDIKIEGLNKEDLTSCSFSTLFLNENIHKRKIIKLDYMTDNDSLSQSFKLISFDEQGNLLVWKLEKLNNLNLSLDPKYGKGMTPLSKFRLNLTESFNFKELLLKNEIKLNASFIFSSIEKISSDDLDFLVPISNDNHKPEIIYFENKTTLKRKFSSNLSNPISFIDNMHRLFLTASEDGFVNLFDLDIEKSIYIWQLNNLVKLNWLHLEFCCCFVALDSRNKIRVFDLNSKLAEPVEVIEFENNQKSVLMI